MEALLLALEGSAPAQTLRSALWLYPAVEVAHIVGFVALVGAAFILDMRLLGRFRFLPVRQTVAALSRWARWSLIVVVPTGVALFMVDATTIARNPAFQLKLAVFAAALLNAAIFHWTVFRRPGWGDGDALPVAARAAGVLSIFLWIAVIAFGRLIAYV